MLRFLGMPLNVVIPLIFVQNKRKLMLKSSSVFHASDYKFDAKKFDSFLEMLLIRMVARQDLHQVHRSSSEDECGDSDSAGGGRIMG